MKVVKQAMTFGLAVLLVGIASVGNSHASTSTQMSNGDVWVIGGSESNSMGIFQNQNSLFIIEASPLLQFHSFSNVGSVYLLLGDGNNTVTILNDVFIDGTFYVTGGSGEDAIDLVDTATLTVADDLIFSGGGGDGSFVFNGVQGINVYTLSVGGDVDVDTGAGKGHVYLGITEIGGDLTIDVGDAGLYSHLILLGAPLATSQIDEVQIGGSLTVNMDGGHSRIGIYDTYVEGRLDIDTREGIDQITLEDCTVDGQATVESRRSDDTIVLNRSNFASTLSVNTGGHSDTVNMLGGSVQGTATFSLANGTDRLSLSSAPSFGWRSIASGGSGTDTISGSQYILDIGFEN